MPYAQSRVSWMMIIAVAVCAGCGGTPAPPQRGVLERDLSAWTFRRYQELTDVEVWVSNNKAVAHTASYVRSEAEKAGRIQDGDIVNAVVTRYEKDTGVRRALIQFARRLARDSGYAIEEDEREGVRLITVSAPDEAWVLWPATRHVIKIGGRGIKSVPGQLIDAYGDRYPSRMDSGMLEGPLPDEPGADQQRPANEPYDPENPTPDWDEYKPGDVNKPGASDR